jgi:DNA-binding PadR family transcriptional regulator
MLRAGWITEVTTGSPGVSRRQRIVYQITPAGTEYFASAVADSGPAAWEDESFAMRFAFFSRTDAGVRMRILEGRRSRLQERLDRARTASGGARGADRYVSELQRHTLESMEREVRWLTDLIDAERTGQQPPIAGKAAGRTAATKKKTSRSTEAATAPAGTEIS